MSEALSDSLRLTQALLRLSFTEASGGVGVRGALRLLKALLRLSFTEASGGVGVRGALRLFDVC